MLEEGRGEKEKGKRGKGKGERRDERDGIGGPDYQAHRSEKGQSVPILSHTLAGPAGLNPDCDADWSVRTGPIPLLGLSCAQDPFPRSVALRPGFRTALG